jgi:hypothetical protein
MVEKRPECVENGSNSLKITKTISRKSLQNPVEIRRILSKLGGFGKKNRRVFWQFLWQFFKIRWLIKALSIQRKLSFFIIHPQKQQIYII